MFGWFKSKTHTTDEEPPQEIREDFHNPKIIFDTFTTLTGINFKQKESITTSKLINFCRNRSIFSFDLLHTQLKSDPILLEDLINFLTVNETYFFREVGQIEYMAQKATEANKPFRVLCAPGSTGEEPYSIAITLLEKGIQPAMIQIVSLDINSDAIAHAKKGNYGPRAFHKTARHIQERYFIHENDRYTVRNEVRQLVTFHQINVFDDALFELGRFDYLFSRNMLIYFDSFTSKEAIERLGRLAQSQESLFFFGHADIVERLTFMKEHYEHGIKFYSL
ncbi:MAG TPA: CheR family methyltransferase [Sulfuricurvum sp.]|nr:CheR family methyltransferase [Sulfuricurvum sp.]